MALNLLNGQWNCLADGVQCGICALIVVGKNSEAGHSVQILGVWTIFIHVDLIFGLKTCLLYFSFVLPLSFSKYCLSL
jgi:hypothetical protein